MRHLANLSLFAVLSASAILSAPQIAPVQAAASVSDGCAYINTMGSAAVGRFVNFTSALNFRAGDVITVSQQGSDWLLIYDVGNGAVHGVDKSASISWKVPANATLQLWAGDNTLPKESRTATVTVTCSGAQPPTPTPVPTKAPTPVPTKAPTPTQPPAPTPVPPPAGATVIGFCQPDGTLYVYTLGTTPNSGSLAYMVSPAEFAAVPTHPAANTVIKSGGGATLTRLTNGLLQLSRPNASGKVYSYTFTGCGK